MLDLLAIALMNGDLRSVREGRVERPRRTRWSRPRLRRRSDRPDLAPALAAC